jgi:hypothetical protein
MPVLVVMEPHANNKVSIATAMVIAEASVTAAESGHSSTRCVLIRAWQLCTTYIGHKSNGGDSDNRQSRGEGKKALTVARVAMLPRQWPHTNASLVLCL